LPRNQLAAEVLTLPSAVEQTSPDVAAIPAADPPKKNERLHLAFLDSLRALAALYVVVNHAAATVPGMLQRHWLKPFQFGYLAVDLFIVISGYCLMLPVVANDNCLRGGALNFYKRRAIRILPPYYFATALSLILIATLIGHKTGTHWDVSIPVNAYGVVTHLLLVNDFFPTAQINHAYWSIAVEWHIYFLFPLMLIAWRRFGAFPTALAVTVVAMAAYRFAPRIGLQATMPTLYALFALGALGASISLAKDGVLARMRDRFPWMSVLAAGCFGCLWLLRHTVKVDLADLPFGVTFACLIVAAGQPDRYKLLRFLSWRPLVFVGTFAYSIYLIHAPLLQVVYQYMLMPLHLSPSRSMAAMAFVGIPLIVALSYGFFLLCERPWLARRPA
jgi:peptidoglycan/LPS O-acetylase OafA/YrhL